MKVSSIIKGSFAGALLATGIATTAVADEFKVGLLTAGGATEGGWNKIAYDALHRTKDELGATISLIEMDHNPAGYEKAFLDFADQGFDLVIGHGFEFQDAAMTVSEEYSDTQFLVTSSFEYTDNFVGVTMSAFQPFYMMGVAAGLRGDKGGYIGGMKIPPIVNALNGFTAGAKSVNPDYEIMSVFIGNFTDSGAAKEAALSMIASGANMIVPNADAAALGAVQAAREAGPDVAVFGAYGDFTDAAPENVLANYEPDFGQGLVEIASQIKAGTFNPGGNIVYGMDNKSVMIFKYNEAAKHGISGDHRMKISEAEAKLISGEIAQ